MEQHRSYQRIEHYLHPVTGQVILENAIWQVYETATLIGVSQMDHDTAQPPLILKQHQHTLESPNFLPPLADGNRRSLRFDQYTFFCSKYGMGTFIKLNILPVTTKMAVRNDGMLCLSRDLKDPTLNAIIPSTATTAWLYTVFHAPNPSPRLEIYQTTHIQGKTVLTSPCAAQLPNCSADGTTCIGETRNEVAKFKELLLPPTLINQIVFGEFNNDLFPSTTNTHLWIFPKGKDTHPVYQQNPRFSTNPHPAPLWQRISL